MAKDKPHLINSQEFRILEAIYACRKNAGESSQSFHVILGGITYKAAIRRQKNRLIAIHLTEDQLLLPGMNAPAIPEKGELE
jgi:hypothetical protein